MGCGWPPAGITGDERGPLLRSVGVSVLSVNALVSSFLIFPSVLMGSFSAGRFLGHWCLVGQKRPGKERGPGSSGVAAGLTGLEAESHGPLTPVPVLRLRRSAARPTRSPRHLPDHKLRSLRRHTYTVRPQVQQVTVFLIIVTPSNAKSALTEHLGLENCGARINPDPRPSSPIPGNVRLSVSTRCSM